jgi:hypothetical protein
MQPSRSLSLSVSLCLSLSRKFFITRKADIFTRFLHKHLKYPPFRRRSVVQKLFSTFMNEYCEPFYSVSCLLLSVLNDRIKWLGCVSSKVSRRHRSFPEALLSLLIGTEASQRQYGDTEVSQRHCWAYTSTRKLPRGSTATQKFLRGTVEPTHRHRSFPEALRRHRNFPEILLSVQVNAEGYRRRCWAYYSDTEASRRRYSA